MTLPNSSVGRLLHIGPPGTRLPGWLNVGPRDDLGADLATDLAVDGIPLPHASTACAAVSLVLHYLTLYEGFGILRDVRRILIPGGVVRLCLVDLDRALRRYLRGGSQLWCQTWSSPGGNLVTQVLEHGTARTPYTCDFAAELLRIAGFTDVRAVDHGVTTSAVADIVRSDVRHDETFVLEATAPARAAPSVTETAPRVCWTADPQTSLSLVWRSRRPDDGWVEVDDGDGWRRHRSVGIPGRWGGFVHTAVVTGLRPEQEVRHRSSGGRTVASRTAPADPDAQFRFGFVCDTGIAGRRDGLADGVAAVVDELLTQDPLFVLGGGDYAYANTDHRFPDNGAAVDAWIEQFRPLTTRTPMVLQFGNHEVALGERWRDYAELAPGPGAALGGRCHSFDVGAAHLAGVFVHDDDVDAEVLQWLEDDLGTARAAGARWLVVWQHAPLFASGTAHPASPRLRRQQGPTLERHRVDLHLSGHDQNYERTFPLRAVAGTPIAASASSRRYRAGSGVIYAKVSPGGKHSNRGGRSRLQAPDPAVVARWHDDAHHVAIITVSGENSLAVDVRSLRGGLPAQTVDHFIIERDGAGRNPWTDSPSAEGELVVPSDRHANRSEPTHGPQCHPSWRSAPQSDEHRRQARGDR